MRKRYAIVLMAFTLFLTTPVFAEDAAPAPAPAGSSTDQTAHPNRQKVEALKRLKEENPEEFQRVVKARKAAIKQKLKELKEKDPQKFQEVKQRVIRQRRERLERLRKENPEKFRQIMQKKRQRFEQMKQTNPEQYERYMQKHPKLAARLAEPGNAGKPSGSPEPAAVSAGGSSADQNR